MKIGLVLHNTPEKSETFLVSKIVNLQQQGHHVVLFANNTKTFNLCKVVPHPKPSKNLILRFSKMLMAYCTLFIIKPKNFLRFLKFEKIDGSSIKLRWRNLYINSNILKEKLDWLHFGFATTAIARENVARSIDSKMGVSIRGYDICIYPLKKINCYRNLWDKIIGYSYFLLRIPYFFILLIFKKREKDRVLGFSLGCIDFFLKKKLM